MQKLITSLFFISAFSGLYSQSFYNLGSDISGDDACPNIDISSIEYTYSIAQDSVWFQFTHVNPIPMENYAFYVAVDNDGDLSNGDPYGADGNALGSCSAGSLGNFNMRYDIMIIHVVYPGGAIENEIQFIDTGGPTTISTAVQFISVTSNISLFSAKLSEVDPDLDGIINLIAAVGRPWYYAYDVAPNGGYYTTGVSSLPNQNTRRFEIDVSPMPFSDKVEFKFDLAIGGYTSLDVLDLQGKILTKVFRKNLEQGSHSVTWNGGGLPTGVYFYQLKSGDGVKTGKIIRK